VDCGPTALAFGCAAKARCNDALSARPRRLKEPVWGVSPVWPDGQRRSWTCPRSTQEGSAASEVRNPRCAAHDLAVHCRIPSAGCRAVRGGHCKRAPGDLDRRVRDRFQQLLGTRKRAARSELDLSLDQRLQQAKSTRPKAGPCRSRSCPACLPGLFEWSSYSWIPTIHVSDSAFEAWVEDEDQGSARAMLRPVAHPAARAHPPSIAPLQSRLFLGFLPLIQPRRPASGGCQKASSPVHWQAPWRTQHTP